MPTNEELVSMNLQYDVIPVACVCFWKFTGGVYAIEWAKNGDNSH
jgi:hypothetical protein